MNAPSAGPSTWITAACYNYHQGRVTDHRIGLTLYKLDAILAGDLDEIVDALTLAQAAENASSSEE